jgi:hypothetical protein
VFRLASIPDWELVEFPSGIGKVSPGWVQAKFLDTKGDAKVERDAVVKAPSTTPKPSTSASAKPAASASAKPAASASAKPAASAKPTTTTAPTPTTEKKTSARPKTAAPVTSK